MPTTLDVRPVTTLRQYMEQIEELMAGDVPLWYRGCGRASHPMIPSLYRHPTITDPTALIALEGRILQRFRERSVPYQAGHPNNGDDWALLFLMQHYGVPTRLLDWTENPYIGLFFALTGCEYDYSTQTASEAAAVWVLRPQEWNAAALDDISYGGGVLSLGSDPLTSYRPSADAQYMRVAPVAMYGIHNNARIVAQRGVFTIFGKDTAPLADVFTDGSYPANVLIKIELPRGAIGALRKSLFSIGITDSVVYPDLGGLAVELKRFYGYLV